MRGWINGLMTWVVGYFELAHYHDLMVVEDFH